MKYIYIGSTTKEYFSQRMATHKGIIYDGKTIKE
jgi:hypothetical protein